MNVNLKIFSQAIPSSSKIFEFSSILINTDYTNHVDFNQNGLRCAYDYYEYSIDQLCKYFS